MPVDIQIKQYLIKADVYETGGIMGGIKRLLKHQLGVKGMQLGEKL